MPITSQNVFLGRALKSPLHQEATNTSTSVLAMVHTMLCTVTNVQCVQITDDDLVETRGHGAQVTGGHDLCRSQHTSHRFYHLH